jgi:hypothetical protein
VLILVFEDLMKSIRLFSEIERIMMNNRNKYKRKIESNLKSFFLSVGLYCILIMGCSQKSENSCYVNPKIARANDSIMKEYKVGNEQFFNQLNLEQLIHYNKSTIRLIISKSLNDTSFVVYQIMNLDTTLEIKTRTIFSDKCKKR